MKSDRLMQRGSTLTLYLMVLLLAGAQTPKKPRMQASASLKEMIYESWGGMQAELKTKSIPAKAPAQTGKSNVAKNETVNKTSKEKKTATPTKSYIALKTNVPFPIVGIQNLAIEIRLHKHISTDFSVMWSIGDIEREHGLHTIAFQPGGRWRLELADEGRFFGLHAYAVWSNLKWKDTRYQSEQYPLLGVGISYGYKLPFSEHWEAEFTFGVGYTDMKYNTYYNMENGAKLDTRKRNYWGITHVGASLAYHF